MNRSKRRRLHVNYMPNTARYAFRPSGPASSQARNCSTRESRKASSHGREITTKNTSSDGLESTGGGAADGYFDRLIKYIPAEIVVLYNTLEAIVASDSGSTDTTQWIVFAICLVMTPLYKIFVLKVKNPTQIAITTLSFVIWIFGMGGPFESLDWYNPTYAALALTVYTFVIANFVPSASAPAES